jgi:hypothetical protein
VRYYFKKESTSYHILIIIHYNQHMPPMISLTVGYLMISQSPGLSLPQLPIANSYAADPLSLGLFFCLKFVAVLFRRYQGRAPRNPSSIFEHLKDLLAILATIIATIFQNHLKFSQDFEHTLPKYPTETKIQRCYHMVEGKIKTWTLQEF